MRLVITATFACFAALAATPALADKPTAFEVTLKDHKFEPAEIRVPAGKPITIKLRNLDAEAEEFDSGDLKIEKIIAGKSEGTVRIKALAPGRYSFIGEFHEDTAKGVVIAE